MGLTDKYQERLDLLLSAKNGYTDGGGPTTYIDRHNAVYYSPPEVKVIRKACRYMGCDAWAILGKPAVGYRILSHIERGYSVDESCELFGQENRKNADSDTPDLFHRRVT